MSLNHDISELGGRNYPIQWDPKKLESVGGQLQNLLRRSITELLSTITAHNEKPQFTTIGLERLCGNVSDPHHSYAVDSVTWGFSLTEPQITKALGYFLDPETHGEAGVQRCMAFMRALYRATGKADPETELQEINPNTLEVKAERGAGSKRIDLAIEWKTFDERRQLVLLECKFDHVLTDGQLSSYQEYAEQELFQGNGDYELFLVVDRLTERTAAELTDNKQWRMLTWRALIRRIEHELTDDTALPSNQDFARLRRTILDKCYPYAF